MARYTTWHGTSDESRDLQRAVNRHCDCQSATRPGGRCAAHEMLVADQRAMNGLLFARRIANQLLREELRLSDTAPVAI